MGGFRAVLFDWRGTLVRDPALAWWVGRALESVGRPVAPEMVDAMAAGLAETAELPELVEAERRIDCSSELQRSVSMRLFQQAGLDSELAEALYRLDLDPASHPLYPDVPDVLATIRALGVKIGFGAQPEEALMVGDRASYDGGAVSAGIPTLLMPAPKELMPRGLDVVLRLLD